MSEFEKPSSRLDHMELYAEHNHRTVMEQGAETALQ